MIEIKENTIEIIKIILLEIFIYFLRYYITENRNKELFN